MRWRWWWGWWLVQGWCGNEVVWWYGIGENRMSLVGGAVVQGCCDWLQWQWFVAGMVYLIN